MNFILNFTSECAQGSQLLGMWVGESANHIGTSQIQHRVAEYCSTPGKKIQKWHVIQFYLYHVYCKPYCAWTTHLDVIIVGLFIPQVNLPDFDCDIVFPTVMEPGER